MNAIDDFKKPIAQYAILGILLLWALVAQVTSSPFATYLQGRSGKYIQLPFVTAEYTTRIVAIAPGYENSGLKVGDNLLALNGQAVEGTQQLDKVSIGLHPGDTVLVTVRRTAAGYGETRNIPVEVEDRYPAQAPGRAFVMGLSGVVTLCLVVIGFCIAFYRVRDPLAWIAMAMLASFGHFAGSGGGWALSSWWRDIVLLYTGILGASWPLWMVLFALYFPVPFDFVRARPWINWLLAAPWIALSAMKIYGGFLRENHIHELGWFTTFWAIARYANILAFGVYICAFFSLLVVKKRAFTSEGIRRQLNLTIAGCLLSLLPFVVVVMTDLKVLPRLPVGAAAICFLMTLLFPITIAYVFPSQRHEGSTAEFWSTSSGTRALS